MRLTARFRLRREARGTAGRRIGRAAAGLALYAALGLARPAEAAVAIAYEPPRKTAFKPVAALLKQQRLLERLRSVVERIDLPRPLTLKVAQCGEENAWYAPENRTVTVCYELIDEVLHLAPKRRAPSGVTHREAVVGAVAIVFLHEIAHGLFDLLRVPILGREEDAADQVAAFTILHLAPAEARDFIGGAGYYLWSEGRSERMSNKALLADEHALSTQRFYNVACLAYGSDPKIFGGLVRRGYLPRDRAQGCGLEYEQVRYAFSRLIARSIRPGDAEGALRRAFRR